jgi:hypothetical protein
MCAAIAGCVAVFFWVYDATAHREPSFVPALARDVGAGPPAALAAAMLIPPVAPPPDLDSPAVALANADVPPAPVEPQAAATKGQGPAAAEKPKKAEVQPKKKRVHVRPRLLRASIRPVLRRRLGSRPTAAIERLAAALQSPPALQTTNAPDAQLGFPGPRRVFTLMDDIGSKTHGNSERSSENG